MTEPPQEGLTEMSSLGPITKLSCTRRYELTPDLRNHSVENCVTRAGRPKMHIKACASYVSTVAFNMIYNDLHINGLYSSEIIYRAVYRDLLEEDVGLA